MAIEAQYERVPTATPDASQSTNTPQVKDVESQQQRRIKIGRRSLIFIAALVFVVLGPVYLLLSFGHDDSKVPTLSLDEWRESSYFPRVRSIAWLMDGEDGEFLSATKKGWTLAQWPNRNLRHILNASITIDGDLERIDSVTLNKDRTWAVVATQRTKHWRHSTFSRFSLVNLETNEIRYLMDGKLLSLVEWSPRGNVVAFVYERNVYTYALDDEKLTQLTFDGGNDVFNGIPDWVYEEEVFAGDKALWWSADGSYLAFMRTNDSLVPKFPIPYFFHSVGGHLSSYPDVLQLKYPKPGFANPQVDVYVHHVGADAPREVVLDGGILDKMITEVVWAGTEKLLVKMMDRESDVLQVHLVDATTAKAAVVRHEDGNGKGWFEVTHNTHFVPAGNGRANDGYIDTVFTDEGWNHLAYFSPLNAAKPATLLTSGNWEVEDVEYSVNLKNNWVYFSAAKASPIERSLHRVNLLGPQNVEDLTGGQEGIFEAKYSGDGSFALVTHKNPVKPLEQRVVPLGDQTAMLGGDIIENNTALASLLGQRRIGTVRYGQVEVEPGVLVNYREILPHGFSEHKKYPLLFFNYGGPGSQQVQKSLTLDFQRIYSETHQAVVVTVDPRGTGYMGRKFRSVVRDRLGMYESHDVISVAKQWNAKPYIDEYTTAIWGWSYGGYLTLKTLEQDVDLAFKYGVAVAPVTDWKLYDSIYTERYMHTPEHNPGGYAESAISNVTALGSHNRFLVMHGTGDDNVHFQNTMALLDQLDLKGIENYDVHVFPDSDHSIYFHNANTIVFDKIDKWLAQYQTAGH